MASGADCRMSRSRSAKTRSPNRPVRPLGPSAWRACCRPPTANFCADEQTEPRGAHRSNPRSAIDRRRSKLLRASQWCCMRGHAPAPYFFRTLRKVVIPNLQRLQSACRRARIEVVCAVVENMTRDGRDRSLDYTISGIDVPRGSWDAQVLDEIAPAEDEMIFRKTSSSVFISTNIDYVLRNLAVRSLIVAGIMTDQCVESAVR